MLNLDQLNVILCIAYSNETDNIYEKHYIHTNTAGIEFFDKNLKEDRPDVYSAVCVEEILPGMVSQLVKPFKLPYDNEGNIINSQDMGFKCKNWLAFRIEFNREKAVQLLQENGYGHELNSFHNNLMLPILKSVIINQFNDWFNKDNVFNVVIERDIYKNLENKSDIDFVHYLDKINLYNNLNKSEVTMQTIISRIKI